MLPTSEAAFVSIAKIQVLGLDLDDTLHDYRGASSPAMRAVFEYVFDHYGVDPDEPDTLLAQPANVPKAFDVRQRVPHFASLAKYAKASTNLGAIQNGTLQKQIRIRGTGKRSFARF